MGINILLPFHLLYCPEYKHTGEKKIRIRILYLLSLSASPPTSFAEHAGNPES